MPRHNDAMPLTPTATRSALLVDGSDVQLRKLIYDLFTVGERLATVRRYLGEQLDISGPQFSVLTSIREIQGDTGATVGDVARHLHITSPFVVTESRKLQRKGLLDRRPDERDGRVARLRLSSQGEEALAGLMPELQRINDIFFNVADSDEFIRVCATIDRFVAGSADAVGYLLGAQEAARMRNKASRPDDSRRDE